MVTDHRTIITTHTRSPHSHIHGDNQSQGLSPRRQSSEMLFFLSSVIIPIWREGKCLQFIIIKRGFSRSPPPPRVSKFLIVIWEALYHMP